MHLRDPAEIGNVRASRSPLRSQRKSPPSVPLEDTGESHLGEANSESRTVPKHRASKSKWLGVEGGRTELLVLPDIVEIGSVTPKAASFDAGRGASPKSPPPLQGNRALGRRSSSEDDKEHGYDDILSGY